MALIPKKITKMQHRKTKKWKYRREVKRDGRKSRSGMQLLRGLEGEEETRVKAIFEEIMDETELLKDAVHFKNTGKSYRV